MGGIGDSAIMGIDVGDGFTYEHLAEILNPGRSQVEASAAVIAGTVYDPAEKEVVIGARVRCLNGGKLYMTSTDEYGDFWFKDLAVGVYDVYVEAKGYKTKAFTGLRTRECVNLGDIALEKE